MTSKQKSPRSPTIAIGNVKKAKSAEHTDVPQLNQLSLVNESETSTPFFSDRLITVLQEKSLQALPLDRLLIRDDGDCLLDTLNYLQITTSVKDWMKKRQQLATDLRKKLVDWLRNNRNYMIPGADNGDNSILEDSKYDQKEDWSDMCERLAKPLEYMDDVALYAASALLNVKIIVLTNSGHSAEYSTSQSDQITYYIIHLGRHFIPAVPLALNRQNTNNYSIAAQQHLSPHSNIQNVNNRDIDTERSENLRLLANTYKSTWYSDSRLNTSSLQSSVVSLTNSATILLIGAMGSGKSSLVNSLIGESLFPMTPPGDSSAQTDTLCVIELYNNPFIEVGIYELRVVLKDPDQWDADFQAYLNTVTANTFRSRTNRNGDVIIGNLDATDLLRALHPKCYDANDSSERDKVLSYVAGNKKEEDNNQQTLDLINTFAIDKALQQSVRTLQFSNAKDASKVLDFLCRSHATRDVSNAHMSSLLSEYEPIKDLLLLGDPWPLVRLVSVSVNLQNKKVSTAFPPFCRLLDSPGLGSSAKLTGSDVLTFIRQCVHDRTVTAVWYVNAAERSINNEFQLDALQRLTTFIGIEKISFIYTKIDYMKKLISDPDYQEEQAYTVANGIHRTLQDCNSDVSLDEIVKRVFYISVHAHSAFVAPTTFNLSGDKVEELKSACNNRIERAGLIAVLTELQQTSWKHITDVCKEIKFFLSDWAIRLTKSPQLQVEESIIDYNQILDFSSDLQIRKQQYIQLLKQFATVSNIISVPYPCVTAEDVVNSELDSKIHPSSAKAIFRNYGKFISSRVNKDIGESIWTSLQANKVGKTESIATEYDKLFRDLERVLKEIIDQFSENLQLYNGYDDEMKAESLDRFLLMTSKAKRSIASDLLQWRQQFSESRSVGNELRVIDEYCNCWREAMNSWNRAATGSKVSTGKAVLAVQLKSSAHIYIRNAMHQWVLSIEHDLINALDSALNQLNTTFSTVAVEDTADERDICRLLFNDPAAQSCLDKAFFDYADRVIKARSPIPKHIIATAPNLTSSDSNWIEVTDQNGKSFYLLFRGLCGLDEKEDKDNARVLLFPHQDLMRNICPEWVPHLECNEQQKALAEGISRCSGGVLVETALRSIQGGNFAGASTARLNETAKDVIEQCTAQNIARLLSPNNLSQVAEFICDCMLQKDDIPPVYKCYWDRYCQAMARFINVPLERQECYTNKTDYFLRGWTHYTRLKDESDITKRSAGKSDRPKEVPCPSASLEGGSDMQSWFHWRWMTPEEFHTPNFVKKDRFHVNPLFSCSQQPEHAIRYAAGLKNYRAGPLPGELINIEYDARLRSINHSILGVVIIFVVDPQWIKDASDRVKVIMQLIDSKALKIKGGKKRIGAEAEVTSYAWLPSDYCHVTVRIPIIAPDLDTVNDNRILNELYRITTDTDDLFKQLKAAARQLRSSNPITRIEKEREFRKLLAKGIARRVNSHFQEQLNIRYLVDDRYLQKL